MNIHSPISGVVIKKNAVEGKYFKEGQEFFEIADLSVLWLYADIYENEISWIKEGLEVSAESPALGGKPVKGKITFIDPVLNPKTRTIKIRAAFQNREGMLKPETFATVKITIPTPTDIIAIPKNAVLDTGTRKIVYVKTSDTEFLGKKVSVGIEAEGYIQILSGLEPGEIVVHNANFLLDSQSQLSGGQEGLYGNALEVNGKGAKKESGSEKNKDSNK